jgi:hypothetical protein
MSFRANTLCLICLGLILFAVFGMSQPPKNKPDCGDIGRFQIVTISNQYTQVIMRIDTVTGKTWTQNGAPNQPVYWIEIPEHKP